MNRRLLLLVVVNLVFALLLTAQAFAGGLTLLGGAARYETRGDGFWYQEAFPHQLGMTAPSVGIRYDFTPVKRGYGLSLGYKKIGLARTEADAQSQDANYDPASPTGCASTCWPASHFSGSGGISGLVLIGVKYFDPWAIEVGAWRYRPTWNVHVQPYYWNPDAPPVSLDVSTDQSLRWGGVLGLRYTIKQWSVNLMYLGAIGDGYTGVKSAIDFSVGYSF